MFGILSALYTTVLWYSIQNCSIYTTLLEYYRCTWRKNQYLNKNHRHSTRKTHPRAKKQVILRLVPLFIWKSLTINYSDNFDTMTSQSALAIRADYHDYYPHLILCICWYYRIFRVLSPSVVVRVVVLRARAKRLKLVKSLRVESVSQHYCCIVN